MLHQPKIDTLAQLIPTKIICCTGL